MYLQIPERHNLSRRHWMALVVQAAGAVSLAPHLNGQDHHAGMAAREANVASSAPWRPRYLSAAQNETLVSLGDRIIPGSAAAACNRVIDLILIIESDKHRKDLTQALTRFDSESQSRYGKTFQAIQPTQQDELLTAASMAESPLFADFNLVKEWIADAYWSSHEGLQELGWTGRLVWANFEGCKHSDSHS
jgi:hypothetical protein